jgi:hypothetical protein
MRRVDRKNDREPEEAERNRVRREPLPLALAILWKPLPDSYHLLASMMRAAEQQAQLFVTQRAFLQVERHLVSAPDLELGGFLAGHVCECPRSRTRYSVINTVIPFAEVSGDPIGARVTDTAYETVQRRLDAHRLALIGWYRNGSGLGLQLLPDDIETHLAYFNEPWQTTMLVVPHPSKPKGAFFTYDPRVGRGYCIPFYELFDGHAAESKRLDRTCVSWTTYVPSMPVQPLAAGDREIVETTVMPMRSEPEPQPPKPIDEWLDAIKDPWVKLKDVAVRTTRRDEPEPLAHESAGRGSQATPKQLEPKFSLAPIQERRAPEAAPVAPIAQRTEVLRSEAVRPVPPFAGPARPAARAPSPARTESAAHSVERQPSHEAPAAPPPAAPRSQPRRPTPPATIEAMLRVVVAPAVALPPGSHEEADFQDEPDFYDQGIRRRRWRIGFVVAAASFLPVILLSTIRARASRSAPAPPAAPVAAPKPPAQFTASVNGDVILALPVAVDSLSRALSYYRKIEADHRGGLVGCRVLDRAYQLVGHARTRVDSARRRVAGALDAADSIRVSMLRAEYTHAAQTHQRSGCGS